MSVQVGAHGHTFHNRFVQGAAGAADGLVAAGAGDDDLGEHGVEHGGDDVSLDDAGLDAHARSGRPAQAGDGPGGRRQAASGIFAGDAQLDAVTARFGDRPQTTAGGDAQLNFD